MGKDGIPVHHLLKDLWLSAILVLSILSVAITAFSLSQSLTAIFPHLFYIPIILAVYRYERDGLYFSILLAFLYIALVYLFTYPDIVSLAQGTVQFIAFVGIAAIVFYLVSRLRNQERKYHGIFGNSQVGIFLVNRADLRIHEVNQRCADILGYRPEDLNGTNMRVFWQNDDEIRRFLGQLENGNIIADFGGTFINNHGLYRYVALSAGRLSEDIAVCTIIDVTERRRAEIMLKGTTELSGMLVRERDVHGLLRKACMKLGCMREGFIVTIWLGREERIAPFAISDDAYLYLLSDRSLRKIIQQAYERRATLSLKDADLNDTISAELASCGDVRAIPMMSGNNILGVLTAIRAAGDTLNDDEVELLATLANDLASTLKLSELEEQKHEAYTQIDKNIEQFAILGDHIRNPLQVIVGLACMEGNPSADRIIEQAYTIQNIVSRLDTGWIESAAIREFLKRHY
jgi:PAS domain S-box-containing protein